MKSDQSFAMPNTNQIQQKQINMKKLLLSAIALIPAMSFAAAFTSPGNGTTFTLKSLSEMPKQMSPMVSILAQRSL